MTTINDCLICAKHRGEGPLRGQLLWQGQSFAVYHFAEGEDGTTPLGRMFIEARRHVPYLADLTPAEAAELGWLRTRIARWLRDESGAAFVMAAVIGLGQAHFHEHVLPRYPGAPADLPWDRSDESAPRGDASTVAGLGRRLSGFLSAPEA